MQMTSCRCICLAPPERQSRRHKRGVAPTSDVTATRRLNVTDRRFFQSPSKQSVFFLFLPSLLFKCFLQTSSQMDLWIKSNRSGKLTIWRVAALFICGFFFGGASMTKLNVTSFFFFFFLHFARKMFILQYISGVFALEQCENKRLKNIFNLQMFGLELDIFPREKQPGNFAVKVFWCFCADGLMGTSMIKGLVS